MIFKETMVEIYFQNDTDINTGLRSPAEPKQDKKKSQQKIKLQKPKTRRNIKSSQRKSGRLTLNDHFLV